MQHPHLLPDDIELLVDHEESPRTALLRGHLAECDDCRLEFELAESVGRMLDRLPHEAPAPGFSGRVMAQVQVFEPWHVALVDTLRRVIPASTPVRVVATAGAAAMALTLTAMAVWAALRPDLVLYAARLAIARVETALVTAGGTLVSDLFGDAALNAVREGGAGMLAAGLALVLMAFAAAAFGLRRLIATARHRGN